MQTSQRPDGTWEVVLCKQDLKDLEQGKTVDTYSVIIKMDEKEHDQWKCTPK